MNHIVIRYSYLSAKAEVTMNGEKASPYSELSTTLNRPFLEAFEKIIPGLDNEIFDDYVIDFYGTAFQHRLLEGTTGKSEFCKEIRFNEIESLISKESLMERLSAISSQCNISIDKPASLMIYNPANVAVPQKTELVTTDNQNADIGIFNAMADVQNTVRIPVILSNSLSVQNVAGRTILIVPNEEMSNFWDYIDLEYRIRPSVMEYMTALRYAPLSQVQKTELESIKNNKPQYFVGEIPSEIDMGEAVTIDFTSFPKDAFSLRSEGVGVVYCTDSRITAIAGGATNILIVNKNGETVAQKPIVVISHHYVEEIRLIPRFEYLKKNERNKIDVIITPLNGEDANQLVWNNTNPNVIQVDENGNIFAISDGKATITVSGHSASATLTIEVKPALQGLRFSQQSVRLKCGETVIIDCEVTPSDAPTEKLTWELDNKTIASINPSKTGKRCQVIASTSYEGKGNVRCYDSATKLGAVCNIEVISKVKQGMAGKLALWCWLIGIIMPFLLPVSAIAGIYGIACDPEPEHKTRYIVCTVGSILTLLFWLSIGMG